MSYDRADTRADLIHPDIPFSSSYFLALAAQPFWKHRCHVNAPSTRNVCFYVYIKAFPSRQRRRVAVLSDLKTYKSGGYNSRGAAQGFAGDAAPWRWDEPSPPATWSIQDSGYSSQSSNNKEWTSNSAWAFSGKDARNRMGANKWRFLRQCHQLVSPGDEQFSVQGIRRQNGLSLPFLTKFLPSSCERFL